MSTRWWAPTESDADWRAMLAPGSDPEKDLGIYLLAAHRAGAQQLTHVAKSSMASESALVGALSGVRPVLSEAMVDAIAPITGEVYAALLVRDVLNEADQGALDVYRTAVSKGVPPPIALERAAAGYGVPTKEMGAFTALAADPKANPRAVEDAADRSLMTYVAKVAAQEAVSEVSKAAPREDRTLVADTDFDPSEHPRGPDGRFVEAPEEAPPLSALQRVRQRLGLLSTEPTKVAETTKAPVLTPSKAKGVELRQARAKRALAARQRQAAKAPVLQQTPLARKTQPRTKPLQRKVSRAKLNALTTQLNLKFKGKTEAGKTELTLMPDLMKRLPDPGGDYYDIGQPIVLGADQITGASLRTQAADQAMTQKDPSRRQFRIGHLVNKAKYVEQQGVSQISAHDAVAEAELTGSPVEYAHPTIRAIKHHELTNPREDFLVADRMMDEMVTRDVVMPSGDVRPVVDYDERRFVQALPVYEPVHVPVFDDMAREQHDHEEAIALVHWQPADPRKPNERPIPIVEEFVVLTDARGYEEGTGASVEIHLDPNQVYEIVNGPNARPGARIAPEQMYDLDNQVVVNRWYLRPIDDDFAKALTPAEAAVFERLHPRDAEGQFTETETETVAEVETKKKPGVELRQARAQRARAAAKVKASRGRTLTPKTAAPVLARPITRAPLKRKVERAPAVQHPLTRALEKVALERRLPEMPLLTDTRRYKVLSERELQRLTWDLTHKDFEAMQDNPGKVSVALGRPEREIFWTRHQEIGVDNIPHVMSADVSRQAARQQVPRDVLDEIPYHSRGGVPDYEHVAERIKQVLENYPDYDLLDIERDTREASIFIYGMKISGSFQNVIEYDPDDIDPDAELYLTFLGKYRARDVYMQKDDVIRSLVGNLTEIGDPTDDALVPNPEVYRYRLTSAPVKRYRIDNG